MSNFLDLLKDVLLETGKSFKDLEEAGILHSRTFYQYKDNTPNLLTIIKIANFLNVSLDYLTGRSSVNDFSQYKEEQKNCYENILSILRENNISQSQLSRDTKIGRPNFTYWKQGRLPKLNTLILLANYLSCSIDEFLDLE